MSLVGTRPPTVDEWDKLKLAGDDINMSFVRYYNEWESTFVRRIRSWLT